MGFRIFGTLANFHKINLSFYKNKGHCNIIFRGIVNWSFIRIEFLRNFSFLYYKK